MISKYQAIFCRFCGIAMTVECTLHSLQIYPAQDINLWNTVILARVRIPRGRRHVDSEKHQCVVVSCPSPTGDLALNPAMCHDWESNWQPFGSQAQAHHLSQGMTAVFNRSFLSDTLWIKITLHFLTLKTDISPVQL